MLLPFGQVSGERLRYGLGPALKHVRDVLEIGNHSCPSLLLQVLIVHQPLADPRLVPGQYAALLGESCTRHQGLIGGWHEQRGVNLNLQVDI